MSVAGVIPIAWFEKWSATGFLVTGLGFLVALTLLVVDATTGVTVPEIAISVIVVPSFLLLFFVAMPGFYPYVADASPRLALGGVVATAIGAGSLAVVTGGKIVLDILGIIGFTEEGPLLAGFFLMLVMYLVSFLCYGLASVRSGVPSRLVGVLLLVIVVEPAVTLLNDLAGIDVPLFTAFATLGIGGLALLGVGYGLRSEYDPDGRTEPTRETTA